MNFYATSSITDLASNESTTPELAAATELESYVITTYQELIGELRWAIEVGRVDIVHEVSVLSSNQSAPCGGHLQ